MIEAIVHLIFEIQIYRPILEQGMPSELTAAVLNLPRREDDGGEKGLVVPASANLNIFQSDQPHDRIKINTTINDSSDNLGCST